MESQRVRIEQGSQPSFGGVLVGVARVGTQGDSLATRLLVTGPDAQETLIVPVGGTVDLFGAGALRVVDIERRSEGARAAVTFEFSPAERRPS